MHNFFCFKKSGYCFLSFVKTLVSFVSSFWGIFIGDSMCLVVSLVGKTDPTSVYNGLSESSNSSSCSTMVDLLLSKAPSFNEPWPCLRCLFPMQCEISKSFVDVLLFGLISSEYSTHFVKCWDKIFDFKLLLKFWLLYELPVDFSLIPR